MPNKIINRRNSGNTTPDQADYRGHVLFDRTMGQRKEKMVRRLRPDEIFSPFGAQITQQKFIG